MARGGAREGAGRKAGGHNRRTTKLQQAHEKAVALAEGEKTPVEILKYLYMTAEPNPRDYGDSEEYGKALKDWRDLVKDAAAKAAPYMHPRLTMSESDSGDAEDVATENMAKRAELLKIVSTESTSDE